MTVYRPLNCLKTFYGHNTFKLASTYCRVPTLQEALKFLPLSNTTPSKIGQVSITQRPSPSKNHFYPFINRLALQWKNPKHHIDFNSIYQKIIRFLFHIFSCLMNSLIAQFQSLSPPKLNTPKKILFFFFLNLKEKHNNQQTIKWWRKMQNHQS